ncbi:unnamed protein product [Miscanthus lutarioriparius]|uniref:USP domain-containing protein n=1 Tax=Miscanthus lutarioriparius TaxID=422564 RepID=A0A811QBE9_9POAL|nr:unnamed protein product [Miscanthus lutarioriparius]
MKNYLHLQINDRYEFPLQLDLDRDNGKYLSPDADRSIRNLYTLHSVLVHSGGVHGGHYYAFIWPTLSDQWYKFDDERVTKEDTKKALEEQYGGEEELPQINPGFNNTPFKFTKYSNAYMLVYIRESDKEKIMCNVDEKDIAEHLRTHMRTQDDDLPECLMRRTELWRLLLSSNSLAGTIPPWIGELARLRVLELSENRLTDGVPPELLHCRVLVRMDLSGILLHGWLPSGLAELKNLKFLSLSGNNFSGGIPSGLG